MSVKITETAAEALISKLDRLVAKNEAIYAAALKDFRDQYMEILSAHTAEKGEAEPVAWVIPPRAALTAPPVSTPEASS